MREGFTVCSHGPHHKREIRIRYAVPLHSSGDHGFMPRMRATLQQGTPPWDSSQEACPSRAGPGWPDTRGAPTLGEPVAWR